MLRKVIAPAVLALSLGLAACDSPTATQSVSSDDFALVMFGEPGSSLEGTMGPQAGPMPFDGRSGFPPLPDSLKLTQAQKDSIAVLRAAFRAAHAPQLDSLKAIFEAARAARQSGATREEVRAILVTGRPIAEALRPDVVALHQAVRAVLTDAQRAWLEAHRPRRLGPPMAGSGPRP
jgi:Spy/CpxP family protein refolding chaperone